MRKAFTMAGLAAVGGVLTGCAVLTAPPPAQKTIPSPAPAVSAAPASPAIAAAAPAALAEPLALALAPSRRTAAALCPMSVLNAPAADEDGRLLASETIIVQSVEILRAPATESCVSSGYGRRNGRLHRGVDFNARAGGVAIAAADGIVREKVTREDFGNMLVIDHGGGVYTLYAHLERFADGLAPGANVARGDALGPIGMTGNAKAPHLHFEILSGDYETPEGVFGLATHNPFPAAAS